MTHPFGKEPVYPLGRESFCQALKTGHGRALIHARLHHLRGLEEEVFEAATSDQHLNAQCEGIRSWWLAQLCVEAGIVERVVDTPPSGDYWDIETHCEVLKELAAVDPVGTKAALREACQRSQDSDTIHGVNAILELEDQEGLRFVVHKYAELLRSDHGAWVDGGEFEAYDDRHGRGAALEFLRETAVSDSAARLFLARVEKTNSERQSSPRTPRKSFEEIMTLIQSAEQPLPWLAGWGRGLSTAKVRKVTDFLSETKTPVVLQNALRILSTKGPADVHASLLQLVDHEDDGVREWASSVLSHRSEASVRDAALRALKRGETLIGLSALRCSARHEDRDEILGHCVWHDDPHERATLAGAVLAIIERSESMRDPNTLLVLYGYSPHSCDRLKTVEYLLRQKACPNWVLEECAADGKDEIRELIRGNEMATLSSES